MNFSETDRKLVISPFTKYALKSPTGETGGGGGAIGFLAVCHSVRPSVCLSFCPSVSQSTRCPSTPCPSTLFSELFSVNLRDIDLKFGIWICLDITQIKFDFGRV